MEISFFFQKTSSASSNFMSQRRPKALMLHVAEGKAASCDVLLFC